MELARLVSNVSGKGKTIKTTTKTLPDGVVVENLLAL